MVGFLRGILLGGAVAAVGVVAISIYAGPPDPKRTSDFTLLAPETSDVSPVTAPPLAPETGINPVVDTVPELKDHESAGVDDVVVSGQADSALPDSVPPRVQVDGPGTTAPVAEANPPVAPIEESAGVPEAGVVASPSLELKGDIPAAAAASPAEPPAQPPSVAPEGGQRLAEAAANPATTADMSMPSPDASVPQAPEVPGNEKSPRSADLPPPPASAPAAIADEALLNPLPESEADPVESAPYPQATPHGDVAPDTDTGNAAGAVPPPATLVPDPAMTFPPLPGLNDQPAGVVTGRLPRIEGAAPSAATDAGATSDDVADESDLPPLQRYARPFAGANGKPLFAILLEDSGNAEVNRQELATLALPITVVIDPLSEGAAARAAFWRAGGQEVVMTSSGIPAGATPSDLEQTFQALSDALPEAVAVIDPDGKTFQDNRPLATLVVPILAGQGRGLVTFDRGLNAADQVARRENLAAAKIFRRIDAEGEDAPVIRRYLDRAAFKAAQDGRVVVIGTLRPETVSAILEWAIEGRSATVTLAPISALMVQGGG